MEFGTVKSMTNDYTNPKTSVPRDELSLDHPPRGIRMERTADGGTVIGMRMFSAASFPILFFALFWNGIVSIFVAIAIAMTAARFGWDVGFSPQMSGNPPPLWFFWLFLTPFIAIGIATFIGALFGIFGRCEIRLGIGEGSVFSGIGSIGRTQRFSPQSIKSLDVNHSQSRSKNGHVTTHTRLVIEMNNGREIKFPGLGKMRETWLAFALNKILRRTTD